MKHVVTALATAAFLGLLSHALARMDQRGSSTAVQMTRACTPAIGDSAVKLAATTGSDADSGALNPGAMYMLRCETDAWLRFGSSAVTAAADDWLIEAGEVMYVPTSGSENMRHVSALSKDVNGDCYLLECL